MINMILGFKIKFGSNTLLIQKETNKLHFCGSNGTRKKNLIINPNSTCFV